MDRDRLTETERERNGENERRSWWLFFYDTKDEEVKDMKFAGRMGRWRRRLSEQDCYQAAEPDTYEKSRGSSKGQDPTKSESHCCFGCFFFCK